MPGLADRHRSASEIWRLQNEFAEKINLHEDSMLVWFVGLSGGAVALTLQLLPLHFRAGRPWLLLVMIAPMFTSAFAGVMGRISLSRLLQIDREVFVRRRGEDIELTERKDLSDEEYAGELLKLIVSRQSDDCAAKEEKLTKLLPKVNLWSRLSQWSFAIGIVWLFGLTVIALLIGEGPSSSEPTYFRPPG